MFLHHRAEIQMAHGANWISTKIQFKIICRSSFEPSKLFTEMRDTYKKVAATRPFQTNVTCILQKQYSQLRQVVAFFHSNFAAFLMCKRNDKCFILLSQAIT